RRLAWMRVARPWRKLPRVCFEVGNVSSLNLGEFDFVLASNILHHNSDPTQLLKALADKLKLHGVMRVVTYPKGSRYWMRETSRWLKARGLTSESEALVRESRRAIRELPMGNPLRSCFESQRETGTRAGLVDAF